MEKYEIYCLEHDYKLLKLLIENSDSHYNDETGEIYKRYKRELEHVNNILKLIKELKNYENEKIENLKVFKELIGFKNAENL